MRVWRSVIAAVVLVAGMIASGAAGLERRVALMGTVGLIEVVTGDRAAELDLSRRVVEILRAAERRLSSWDGESALSRLNGAAGRGATPIEAALGRDLGDALDCARRTGGAFDPLVGPLVEAWDLRGAGRLPVAAERRAALARVGLEGLHLDLAASTARLAPGHWIDAGGFGKGAALRDVQRWLLRRSVEVSLAVNLGGQVLASGDHPVPVALADPAGRGRTRLRLALRRASIATSANTTRWRSVQGRRIGHILDPRTGDAATFEGSVSVVHRDPLWADCLSTGLFVLGPARAMAWARRNPDVGVILIDRDRVIVSPSLAAAARGSFQIIREE